ncbi:hypothetical protein LINGRAHAP2_LOCUS34963 [Linum grandiflorum]
MEFFTKTMAVKLRSHLDKCLIADPDFKTVRQTRTNASSRRATWLVELIPERNGVVRLRSCHGTYLTASDARFRLGVMGSKVVQTVPDGRYCSDEENSRMEWRPVRDGFQVRLKNCWCGKYLRANGGTPPWRNSVTNDNPNLSPTLDWVLWTVEAVVGDMDYSVKEYLSSVSNLSSLSLDLMEAVLSSDDSDASPEESLRVAAVKSLPRSWAPRSWDKAVKLRSHLDKYLLADDDRLTVRQTRNFASSRHATWFVEFLPHKHDVVRLRSCFGTYLTASDSPFLLGVTGRKVTQTSPDGGEKSDALLEWRPVRDGFQVRLVSSFGKYLRGNGGTPPWRNSVTHDDPAAGATRKWILWDVEAAIAGETESVVEYLSSVSSVSSISDELLEAVSDDYKGSSEFGSPAGSPMSVVPAARKASRLTMMRSFSPKLAESTKKKVRTRL